MTEPHPFSSLSTLVRNQLRNAGVENMDDLRACVEKYGHPKRWPKDVFTSGIAGLGAGGIRQLTELLGLPEKPDPKPPRPRCPCCGQTLPSE